MHRSYDERIKKKAFKMNIINGLIGLTPKERAAMIREIVQKQHTIPFSQKESLSERSLYRWIREFKNCNDAGDALMGKVRIDRRTFPSLTEDQKAALIKWRLENEYRTLEDLREELLHHESTCSPSPPSPSTIGRFLMSQGLSRKDIEIQKPQMKIRLSFEAEYPQQIWMTDTKGPDIYVINPQDTQNDVIARPIAILDDNSRFIVAIAYVIAENEAAVISFFCEAILVYGIPEILYCDRGSPYMGKSLKKSASLIGCNVMHTCPSDPEAKGKVEKVLRTVHERFEHEMIATKRDRMTLAEYNEYLIAYIKQDYHRSVHASTQHTPEECFFAYPQQLRRWITRDNLMRIFLPLWTVVVSKTGLVRVKKRKYLVMDASLWGKKLNVRQEYRDQAKVYLWYDDKYRGEAFLYAEENDFINRSTLKESIQDPPEIYIRNFQNIPAYGRLERQLAKYREEMESLELNEQLEHNKEKKQRVRALTLTKTSKNEHITLPQREFLADTFVYLMMKLLRRRFSPSERLSCHTLWNALGSLDEIMVRKTVGRLLGEEYSTNDLKGYLEEIRICMLTQESERGF